MEAPSSGTTSSPRSVGPGTGESPGQTLHRRTDGLLVVPPRRPRPSDPRPYLSDRSIDIINDVKKFRQMTSQQILRIYFMDNAPKSRESAMCEVMERLTKWGYVRRLPRAIGGAKRGSGPYVYAPPGRSRDVRWHTLDIAELYVRLVEAKPGFLEYKPEAHEKIGHLEIKPDALVRVQTPQGVLRAWIEVDEGDAENAEWTRKLNKKMSNQVLAYHKYKERGWRNFPRIVFTVQDDARRRFVESVVKKQDEPWLFTVVLFEDAASYLIGEQ